MAEPNGPWTPIPARITAPWPIAPGSTLIGTGPIKFASDTVQRTDGHPICPNCNGRGYVTYAMPWLATHTADNGARDYPCPQCLGEGKLPCECEVCKRARKRA